MTPASSLHKQTAAATAGLSLRSLIATFRLLPTDLQFSHRPGIAHLCHNPEDFFANDCSEKCSAKHLPYQKPFLFSSSSSSEWPILSLKDGLHFGSLNEALQNKSY